MYYKLFIEAGNYQDIDTFEPRNMLSTECAYTPEGINVGWDFFETDAEAMAFYNIELSESISNV